MAAILSVRGLTIGYGAPLLRDLDFEVARGGTLAILGGSGCGKSTLLRSMIGLQAPLAGSVTFHGIDGHGIDGHDIDGHGAGGDRVGAPLAADAAPAFGVLFQSSGLLGSLTVLENVALPLRTWTRLSDEAVETIAMGRLRIVGLAGFENHLPAELSGGMRKRAGIARALALDPRILFLDEPTAGLDPETATEIDGIVRTLSRALGVTTVFVTHDLDSILAIADDCLFLDKREQGIIARGDPRRLQAAATDARVRAFFARAAARDQTRRDDA